MYRCPSRMASSDKRSIWGMHLPAYHAISTLGLFSAWANDPRQINHKDFTVDGQLSVIVRVFLHHNVQDCFVSPSIPMHTQITFIHLVRGGDFQVVQIEGAVVGAQQFGRCRYSGRPTAHNDNRGLIIRR
ncbi:hypothetical protein HUJ05_007392 [Dendroctonus ponderosae]|nr:hypothetical protein HUJ05_007392 [Dendroctonus ponderosae]